MLNGGARAIRDEIAAGRVSAVEVCRAFLERIEAVNPSLNVFNFIAADRALARAGDIDRRRAAGQSAGPLTGVPVALKDNLCVRGMRTTASSRILDRFIPPYDATAVQRMEAAGAVIVGKTNCDEFAMGSSNENSAYGPVRNPWSTDRTPGGSSGGSAAAVAVRCAPLALGSDTGGSLRLPASFCGVVGLKPTYGRVSRYGLLAFASSLDQIGPIAGTASDVALALSVLAGPDPADATSSQQPVPDFTAALTGNVTGLRIGVPRAFVTEGVDEGVRRAFDEALDTLRRANATLIDIDLPHARFAIPVYYLVATAEASSNLARYDGVRFGHRSAADGNPGLKDMYSRTRDEGFGTEVKRRIMLGTYVLSAGYYDAFYLKAQQVRTLLRPGLRRRIREGGCRGDAHEPDAAFPAGREDGRPAADVSWRRVYGKREPGGPAGDQRALRLRRGTPAGWPAVDRPVVRRINVTAGGRRLRAAHELAHAAAYLKISLSASI